LGIADDEENEAWTSSNCSLLLGLCNDGFQCWIPLLAPEDSRGVGNRLVARFGPGDFKYTIPSKVQDVIVVTASCQSGYLWQPEFRALSVDQIGLRFT